MAEPNTEPAGEGEMEHTGSPPVSQSRAEGGFAGEAIKLYRVSFWPVFKILIPFLSCILCWTLLFDFPTSKYQREHIQLQWLTRFQSGCTDLPSHQQCLSVPDGLYLVNTWHYRRFFILMILWMCGGRLWFYCFALAANEVGYFYLSFFQAPGCPLWKMPTYVLPVFQLGCLSYFLFIFKNSLYTVVKTLRQLVCPLSTLCLCILLMHSFVLIYDSTVYQSFLL